MFALIISHLSAHDQRIALGFYYDYVCSQTLPLSGYLLF